MGTQRFREYRVSSAELLLAIQGAAQRVGEATRAHAEGIMAERAAEAALVAGAVERMLPALPAMLSKIEKFAAWSSGNGPGKAGETVWHPFQGVLVLDRFSVFSDALPGAGAAQRDARGRYGGVGVYVLADGSLARAARSGTWSKVKGEDSERTTVLDIASVEELLEEFEPEDLLEGMLATLEKQAKGREGAATRAQAWAERLRDALFLLREE